MKVASFDIFDTTLIRKCGRPSNIFYMLSKSLFPDNPKYQESFYNWRLHAEQEIKDKESKQNPQIEDIYSSFNRLIVSGYSAKEVIEKEQEIESQMLVSNMEIKERIADMRNRGYVICFISDMYLNVSFLKNILIREGCASHNDDVFVSCDCGYRKDTGMLYDYIRSVYGDIQEWVHYGDNLDSDYRRCIEKNIRPIHVDTSFNKREILIEKRNRTSTFARELSLLIGFQRGARLHLSNNNVDYDNAADFVVSAYIPYIFYVLEQSKRCNIHRLYFLSRDCYLHYKVVDAIKEKYHIDCKYLFLSRKALALPLLYEISRSRIEELIGGNLIGQKCMELVKLFQLDDLEIDIPFDTIKSEWQAQIFVDKLRKKKDIIQKRQKESKNLLEQYLSQEGVLDMNPSAIVDLGWLGTTRRMINEIRREKHLEQLTFFYYGCRKEILNNKYGDYYSFQPNEFCTYENTIITESYYSVSKYPSTIGYKNNNGVIVPVFDNSVTYEKLSTIHVKVCLNVINTILSIPFINFREAMTTWGNSFITIFSDKPQLVNYSTMRMLQYRGGRSIIEHISPYLLLRFCLLGSLRMHGCLEVNSIYDTYKIVLSKKISPYYLIKKIKHRLISLV